MRRKVVLLAGLMGLVSLTGFASDAIFSPAPLQAQGCGAYTGPMCAADCAKECTSGGCCGWLFYYYRLSQVQDN